ncbi:MAG: 6-bladed beta-propeller [Balneolaceae bacterium]
MTFPRTLTTTLSVLTLFGCLISCTWGSDRTVEVRTSEVPRLEFGDSFTLSAPEDVYLQQISQIKSDSKGRIYISDGRGLQIHVFDAQGDYISSIGREGEGPGEFRSLMNIYVDSNDKLYAFDISQARSTIFVEENNHWEPEKIFAVDGQRYGIESADADGNLILRQGIPKSLEPGVDWFRHELATGHLSSGLKERNALVFNDRDNIVSEDNFMIPIPFGRTTITATDPTGNVYLIWNESFEVAAYDAGLRLLDSLRVPIPNQLVSLDERDEVINRMGSDFRSLVREHIPDTKPVISNLVVDGYRNLWLQTYDSPEYLVLGSEGSPLGSFDLQEGRQLLHVDTDQLYAVEMDEEGYHVHVIEYQL